MDAFYEFIQNVGFPGFIAIYLLFVQSKQTKEMQASVNRNTKAINALVKLINDRKEEGKNGD